MGSVRPLAQRHRHPYDRGRDPGRAGARRRPRPGGLGGDPAGLALPRDRFGQRVGVHQRPSYRYGQGQEIQFTRGRPYKRDDNAHIEQKNWTHVRKLVGYWRYDTPAAVAALNARYQHVLRLFHNLFLPSVKLVAKERRRAPAPPLRCASHATTQDPSPQDDVLVGLGELMPSLAEWNISGRRRLASGQIPVGHGIVDCHRHDKQRADELGWARYGMSNQRQPASITRPRTPADRGLAHGSSYPLRFIPRSSSHWFPCRPRATTAGGQLP